MLRPNPSGGTHPDNTGFGLVNWTKSINQENEDDFGHKALLSDRTISRINVYKTEIFLIKSENIDPDFLNL